MIVDDYVDVEVDVDDLTHAFANYRAIKIIAPMQPESPTLSAEQWRTLQSLVNRIIPWDDNWPSGWQAGVGNYLARQFERDLRDQVQPYRLGLEALERESHARTGKQFSDLSSAAQDAMLADIEHGQTRTDWPDAATFFAMAIQHAMEGFYSDPSNGGNKGAVSWAMIGYIVTG